MTFRADIGQRGEQAAAEWLQDEGFRLLHRNWRKGRYEIDIVAARGDVVHFVEVRCRAKGSLLTPEETVTAAKQRAQITAARAYLAAYGLDVESQFDLIAVEHSPSGMEVRYIPNAFYPRW